MTTPLALTVVVDASVPSSLGLKGAGAADWLRQQGIDVPADANSWRAQADGALVLRLGRSEFLVEGAPESPRIEALRAALGDGATGVYPVPRYDTAMRLGGRHVRELLLQTCSFDFESLAASASTVVMISMAGVGVTVIADAVAGDTTHAAYRLWCDGSYGDYLASTLTTIADELAVELAAEIATEHGASTPDIERPESPTHRSA